MHHRQTYQPGVLAWAVSDEFNEDFNWIKDKASELEHDVERDWDLNFKYNGKFLNESGLTKIRY